MPDAISPGYSTAHQQPATKSQCPINAVVSMGRRNTRVEPDLH